jgi:hypothetical protein
MKTAYFKNTRILAITPSTRGIGFAILEGHNKLLDWGVRGGKGDKNKVSIVHVKTLIARERPEVIVLQEMKEVRRAPRIKTLNRQIIAVVKSRKVNLEQLWDKQVKRKLLAENEGTRHALAEAVARRFPNELGLSLPPKRKPWKSEDPRIDFFYAVALALTLRLKK